MAVFFVSKKDMDNKYKSEDITFTSFLLTSKIKLLHVERTDSGRFTFFLSNPHRCVELKRQYLNGAVAPAIDLFNKRELLISQIKNFDLTRS